MKKMISCEPKWKSKKKEFINALVLQDVPSLYNHFNI